MSNQYPNNNDPEFVFKSLKVYVSDEWMANVTKKYRTVFDLKELSQLGVELSFYNTRFNETSWEADILLTCFRVENSNNVKVCEIPVVQDVPSNENTIQVHKKWIPENDKVLEKGTYTWTALINGEYAGESTFYVENTGKVNDGINPYFELKSVKLYNAPKNGEELEGRIYLKQFNREKTQYVWVQLEVVNKVNTDWFCEVFYNFYDNTGLMKESVTSFNYFEPGYANERFILCAGWGSEKPGYWLEDNYYINIVFMDSLIATVPLRFGDEEIEGEIYDFSPGNKDDLNNNKTENAPKENQNETLEEVMRELNSLIGLKEIKKRVNEYVKYVEFVQLRKQKGYKEEEDFLLHSVFTGNPGTGKTTVVKLLGQIYQKIGLLSKGHVHEVDRSDIVGEYIGQTAPMTKRAIDKARGGILFIDEAYMLARDSERDFGKEAIEVILKEMSDGPGDIAIMVAGYPKEMEKFLNTNPGLRSRFKYKFHFEDYTPDELFDISLFVAKKRAIRFTEEAKNSLKDVLIDAYRKRDKNFGNARFATYLIDQAKLYMGIRLLEQPDVHLFNKEVLSVVLPEDLDKIVAEKEETELDIPIDKELLQKALKELNQLTGLENIKQEINELVKLVNYYREMGYDVLNKFSLHTVFTGNPGTGKTTVARIIGEIYKALGLLERGHVVETDREGLVAGYVGQTAIKTKEKINHAFGGVLFIDEAYALSRSAGNNFGEEAIEVILKNMEDKRGQFAVIAAGYPDNMYQFLESNPGLKSRFDRTLHFKDYNQNDLYKIALNMFSRERLFPDEDASAYLKNYFKHLVKTRDKYFGNAREVRKIVTEVIRNQNLRMAGLSMKDRTKERLKTIILDDVDDFVVKPVVKKASVGFRSQHLTN